MAGKRDRLDIEADLAFQRRDWAFERIGWIAILTVVVAAALGFMGSGPLSRAEHTSPDHSVRVSMDASSASMRTS